MTTKLNICIATGIFPPEIGGPAEYAANLAFEWKKDGHEVSVGVFSKWHHFPTGLRHLLYFFAILNDVRKADLVIILDTFSAAFPATIASLLFGKKILLRTGGDFLWEQYVERTGDLVFLSEFYKTRLAKLSFKEKIVFKIIRFVLQSADTVIFSTKWQEGIFWHPYGLQNQKTAVIENFYGPKIPSSAPSSSSEKKFIASVRNLKWKNISMVKEVFNDEQIRNAGAIINTKPLPHDAFISEMDNSYALILASLGDISPNTVLDAIRLNKPFIITSENGISERIRDIAVSVDPKNKADIREKVLWLLDQNNYAQQKSKIASFTFTHAWEEMAREYIDLYNTIK